MLFDSREPTDLPNGPGGDPGKEIVTVAFICIIVIAVLISIFAF